MGTITTYDPWDDPPSRNSHSRPFCQQRIQAYFAARPPGGEWDIRDLKSMEEKPLVEYLLSGISTVMYPLVITYNHEFPPSSNLGTQWNRSISLYIYNIWEKQWCLAQNLKYPMKVNYCQHELKPPLHFCCNPHQGFLKWQIPKSPWVKLD